MLIWHIDEAQSGNTDENHYKVALMQADRTRDMERNLNRGDAGDVYPGSNNNDTFDATSNPNSKSYANVDTCVAVSGISASGPAMTMQVQVRCPGAQIVAAQAVGKGAPGAKAAPKGAAPPKRR